MERRINGGNLENRNILLIKMGIDIGFLFEKCSEIKEDGMSRVNLVVEREVMPCRASLMRPERSFGRFSPIRSLFRTGGVQDTRPPQ